MNMTGKYNLSFYLSLQFPLANNCRFEITAIEYTLIVVLNLRRNLNLLKRSTKKAIQGLGYYFLKAKQAEGEDFWGKTL